MNSKITKYGAASAGAVTLLATTLSLGGGTNLSKVGDASRSAGRDIASTSMPRSLSGSTMGSPTGARSPFVDVLETFVLSTQGDGVRAVGVKKTGSSGESSDSTSTPPTDEGADSFTITIPHQVTVTMPRYEGGRAPSVTPPTYQRGTDPSAERDGRKIVIDTGESGTWTAPEVDPGAPGSFTPPQVTTD